ncbi:MAG: cation diffusion facilitator family transporter [Rhodopseudomonas sp.]|nr:cation diffusion facilitator family transporter [Rhodopseudomonas sp.]
MASSQSKTVVYAAATGNLLVALTKFIAASWTGSSAMLSEAIHSVVDTGNQLVLLYGLHRAAKPPDAAHPLGYGRELYFWSFIVALLLFTLGAGVALYEGITHIANPSEIVDARVSYIVYCCAAVFEGSSWYVALREFRKAKGDVSYYEAVRRSKDPPTFIVLFEDTAALIGLVLAAIGTVCADSFAMPVFDGAASIGIGLVLALTAWALARESKELLIGEPARPKLRNAIVSIARSIDGIENAQLVFSVHLAPEQVIAALSLEFGDTLTTTEIEAAVDALDQAVHRNHPEVTAIFVKPQATVTMPALIGRLPGRASTSSSTPET